MMYSSNASRSCRIEPGPDLLPPAVRAHRAVRLRTLALRVFPTHLDMERASVYTHERVGRIVIEVEQSARRSGVPLLPSGPRCCCPGIEIVLQPFINH